MNIPAISASEPRCTFIPSYLMERLHPGQCELDDAFRAERARVAQARPAAPPRATDPAWVVHDCGNTTQLPGTVARSPGDPAGGDAAVDEAAEGIAGTLALYAEVYGRDSYDAAGARASLSVHYGRDYANAFWDGTQLVFGDGDGEVFGRFTRPVDVLGHEFTHAVVEHAAGLVYRGQSGALNESVADVFGACLKQRLLGQSVAEADWVVGEGLFLPGVTARGLRDMKNPGTAYDDPRLGRDPQPAHMDDYVDTQDDNGGVHLNSGIPNRAFVLAAEAIGGNAAEGAGRIWYAALTGGEVGPNTDFAGFAAATIAAAGEHTAAVEAAWAGVGVGGPAAGNAGEWENPAPAGGHRVRVRRSGGFAGLTTEAEVDLGAGEIGSELRMLLVQVNITSISSSPPQPDRYVYELDLDGDTATVGEPDLTPELRRIVELVLSRGSAQ